MNAVVEATETLSVIERAALNPAIDVEKLERLLAMQERILARNAEAAFNEALSACQADMGPISADSNNPQTKSKYASYAKLDRVLRPIYTKHGLALSFDEGDSPKPQHIRVLCHVSHRQGHTRTYQKDMPADGKGAKGGDVMTLTHAAGAAMSYGMRYLLKGIFNVAVGENDNDGNGLDTGPTISEKQVLDLTTLIKDGGGDISKLLRYWKIERLDQIPAKNYDKTVAEVKLFARQRQERRS